MAFWEVPPLCLPPVSLQWKAKWNLFWVGARAGFRFLESRGGRQVRTGIAKQTGVIKAAIINIENKGINSSTSTSNNYCLTNRA
ncbi:hypothetical protein JMJ77_0002285 [Colletotrichum scovillei]|uniref:Uncharacterized protein n=1 Tax=Colletotrichum scovillei TaxID=1209932 RepID=A0A9P7R9B6_9PEZI|nr:hypothetical protein JMJ77_0002285 [Colletotrichum scovillei]KAG7070705.1 hypothetical protein JMJ76_0001951 [Colletotrichum scovillei]KAG7078980.1 hypothetical protein JMJ78_0002642 [Colletotrichum scovillei]